MPRIDLNSTALEAATYQDELALLELEFRSGEIYQYDGVPAQTYQALLMAESKGAYFHSHIRNRFAYAKIHPAKPKPGC
ncbi:MAG: KTSC domain-containing protein [Acidobacteriia bacterium]|nr:KTSC domain-containing protein [Terriglobia bacterium]